MKGRILVLGAAGRLGRIAAEAFHDAGWQVASLVRSRAARLVAPGTEVVEVDARDTDSVVEAAQGADIVVHALNLPYTEWERGLHGFADTAVAAAHAAGATLMFPGNVYGYGSAMPAVLDETTPMRPTSRKGALRVAIETRLRQASGKGLRVIIVRAGDFYGGGATGSWFDRFIAKDLAQGRVAYPGPLDMAHAWAYLPDLAGALVRLAAVRDTLPGFAEFGFAGHTVTGRELVDTLARATGKRLRVNRMPWWLLRALSPVVPVFRELSETAYLWSTPHRIDGSRLAAVIGEVPHTPFADAVAIALRELAAA